MTSPVTKTWASLAGLTESPSLPELRAACSEIDAGQETDKKSKGSSQKGKKKTAEQKKPASKVASGSGSSAEGSSAGASDTVSFESVLQQPVDYEFLKSVWARMQRKSRCVFGEQLLAFFL